MECCRCEMRVKNTVTGKYGDDVVEIVTFECPVCGKEVEEIREVAE